MSDATETPAEGAAPAAPREINQGGADRIEADSIVMNQSAAKEVSAREARLEESAVVVVEATEATISNSACVQVLAEEVNVVNSPALMVAAERATFRDSPIFLYIGAVGGDPVTPKLDWRGAVGLGAAFGVGLAVAGALLGRLTRGR
jgi:hypothetical protein